MKTINQVLLLGATLACLVVAGLLFFRTEETGPRIFLVIWSLLVILFAVNGLRGKYNLRVVRSADRGEVRKSRAK